MSTNEQLRKRVEQQARRMKKAEKDRPTLISQTVYMGRWLDGLVEGYSVRWTLSMLFLGIIIGAANVYLFIRE